MGASNSVLNGTAAVRPEMAAWRAWCLRAWQELQLALRRLRGGGTEVYRASKRLQGAAFSVALARIVAAQPSFPAPAAFSAARGKLFGGGDAAWSDADAARLARAAGVRSPEGVAQIEASARAISFANRVAARLAARSATPYKRVEASHEAMLEDLWTRMRPGVARTGGRDTAEWGTCGFQGRDPATDFRGMGLLALDQMVHLARTRPDEAIAALAAAQEEDASAYLPYAVACINTTAFVNRLLALRLLDARLFAVYQRDGGPGADEAHALDAAVDAVHDYFASLVVDLVALWVRTKPDSVMSFPSLFMSFRKRCVERLLAEGAWCIARDPVSRALE